MGSNQSLDHSEVGHSKMGHSKAGHSEVNHFKLVAEKASPVPSREASEDCSGVAYDGEIPNQGCFDSHQEQIAEVIQRPLQNHDRMFSGRRYCLLITVHEATKRGHWALPKSKWNSTNIADMVEGDLDVIEAVILDHIAAILYVGR